MQFALIFTLGFASALVAIGLLGVVQSIKSTTLHRRSFK